jgi:hypothetical protein
MEMDYDYERHLQGDDGAYSMSSDDDDSSDDEFWDDDDDEELLYFMYVGSTIREDKYKHVRLSWDQHVEKLQHEGMFSRTYRMTHSAFLKLLSLIGPKLSFDTGLSKQTRGAEVIQPEVVMAIALRWLAGGSYIDIRHAYFCSAASIYRCRDLFIDAILTCQACHTIPGDCRRNQGSC